MSNLPDRIPPFALLLRAAILTLLMAWMSGGLEARQFAPRSQLRSTSRGERVRLAATTGPTDWSQLARLLFR